MSALLLGCITTASAGAATLTVTSTADSATPGDGQCSLREAIEAANSPGSPSDCGLADALSNTIVLGPNKYDLTIKPTGGDDQTTGDLDVNATAPPLTITGSGAAETTISAAGLADRAFNFLPGSTVTLEGLTITGAHAPNGANGADGVNGGGGSPPTNGSFGFPGGGLRNGGTLTLTNVDVTGNTAGSGGAGGTGQTLEKGADGGIGGAGGGISNDPTGKLTLTDVTVSGNTAGGGGTGGPGGEGGDGGPGGNAGCCGDGGGLENNGGTVTITDSTFTGNHAGAGGAGGRGADAVGVIGVGGSGGTGAGGSSGGAIASTGGTVTITNSTLSSNTSGVGGNGGDGGASIGAGPLGGNGGNAGNGSAGGGVFATGGATVTLLNVTVDGNDVGAAGTPGLPGPGESGPGMNGAPGQPAFGGGVYAATTPAMKLTDTLLGTNHLGNCAGQVNDAGHNLTFGTAGCPATFLVGDPKLGPLQDNGGPTATIALGAGSAAIDQVPASGAECPKADQRGVQRPQPAAGACDIGAYEVALPALGSTAVSAITTSAATLTGSVTANAAAAGVRFEFGTTSAYGSSAATATVGGLVPEPVSATLTGLQPGTTYHFRLVAGSADGTAQSDDATFTTASVPEPPASRHFPAPSLTKLKLTPAKFRARPKHGKAKGRTGTTISYADSLTATTTLVILKQNRGVRHHGRCVKRARHSRGSGCSLLSRVMTFTHNDHAGANTVPFNRHLAPGRYLLEATPLAGGISGRTVSASFTVAASA